MSFVRPRLAVGFALTLLAFPAAAQEPDEPERRFMVTSASATGGRSVADLAPERDGLIARLGSCRDDAARLEGNVEARFRLRVNARGRTTATSLAAGAVTAEERRWHHCAMRVLGRTRLAAGAAGTLDVIVTFTDEHSGEPHVLGGHFGSSLETRGTGRGGGGTGEGTIGLGTLRTVGGNIPSHPRPFVRALVPEVSGPLPPEVIRRFVRRHLNEVRFCYEMALRASPELAGEIHVSFTIAADGSVPVASITSDTIESPEVARCIVRRPRLWRFPTPEGGGTVVVRQPYVLRPPGVGMEE